jgi:hypothetical protein
VPEAERRTMRPFAAGVAVLCASALAACGTTAPPPSTSAADTRTAPASAGAAAVSPGTTASATQTASTSTTAAATATSATDTTGADTTGSDGGVPTSGPAGCRAAGLTAAFLGGQGATGHGELGFALRNTGSGPCSTGGYPGAQFVDSGGAALPTVPTHATTDFFGSSPERALVLAAGQTVSFRLDVSHGSGSGADCHTASALRVIAPNDTATLMATIPGGALECGAAIVSPVQPGDSAYR